MLSIALTGQALLQADVRQKSRSVFDAIKPLLNADVTFTNLETTIGEKTDDLSVINPLMGEVSMPPEALDALSQMGVNLFAVSNNHSFDLKDVGMANMVKHMRQRNLTFAGMGENLDKAFAPAYLDTPKGKVALISFGSGLIQPESVATETKLGIAELHLVDGVPEVDAGRPNPDDARRVREAVGKAAKEADFVISYHHNHVFDKSFIQMMRDQAPERLVPPPWVKTFAREQIDAGADMVVMHGVPIVHGIEMYKGKPIFYGIGNFAFQMPLETRLFEPIVYESVIMRAEFDGKALKSITLTPIVIDPEGRDDEGEFSRLSRGLPMPASGAQAESILKRVGAACAAFGVNFVIDNGKARYTV